MSKKQWVIVILIAAVLVGLYYWYYASSKAVVRRDLSADQKTKLENQVKDSQQAINDLNNNGSAKPEQVADTYTALGIQYFGLGRLADAEDAFQKAVVANPKDPKPLISLSEVQLERGNRAGAEKSLQKAAEVAPQLADAWRRYITIKSEDTKFSSDSLNKLYLDALVKSNSNVEIVVMYAQFLEKQGRMDQAIDQWKEVVKLQPSNQVYKQELERVSKLQS